MSDAHYEYRFDDRSLVLRWLGTSLFMRIVRVLPRRFTPNQITLFGHVCIWSSAAVALSWPGRETLALLALAFGYTTYNIADTIDGMYARYSGQTSRLGELLDHGLDPFGIALVPLTYGIALQQPAWLVLGSTATVAYVQFLTFLHGYRVGHVILGEIGVIEGLATAAAICGVAALGGRDMLTRPLFFDVSWAGVVAIAFIAGALPAALSMRGLRRHPADLIPLALLIAAIVVWHAFGALGVRAAGLLVLFTAAYEMILVTAARLRRQTLALWDWLFVTAIVAAAGASLGLGFDAGTQTTLASALIVYMLIRSARVFFQTVAATQQEPLR